MSSTSAALDVYDAGNGVLQAAWAPFGGVSVTSYNVYVNGVLNQNVATRQATIAGLTEVSYSQSAVAAPSGNSLRPQNMPPNGVVTPSGTYDIRVTALVGANEVSSTPDVTVTMQPTSVMLKTQMKRLWPFPNTGLD